MGMLVAIAIGGALGSLARYGITIGFEEWLGREFPYGIFIANVLGSFAIGVCFVVLFERDVLPEFWRGMLMIGFLGAFTTFSTFSLHTVAMLEEGKLLLAAGYTIGSVVLSIAGAYAGLVMTRLLSS